MKYTICTLVNQDYGPKFLLDSGENTGYGSVVEYLNNHKAESIFLVCFAGEGESTATAGIELGVLGEATEKDFSEMLEYVVVSSQKGFVGTKKFSGIMLGRAFSI